MINPTLKGRYEYGVDQKGRLFIPKPLRSKVIARGFVLTIGLDRCLALYSSGGWQGLLTKLENLKLATGADGRHVRRMMLANAMDVEIDHEGRILMPRDLRDMAGIRGTAVIVGAADHIEIWAKHEWDKYYGSAKSAFQRAQKELQI